MLIEIVDIRSIAMSEIIVSARYIFDRMNFAKYAF